MLVVCCCTASHRKGKLMSLGYYAKLPKSNGAIARMLASRAWGPEINSQTKIVTKLVSGYVGSFSTPGHGGYVAVSNQIIPHLAMGPYRVTGDVWPPEIKRGYNAVYKLPESLYCYVLEEDCAWSALIVALPEIAGAVIAANWPSGNVPTPNQLRESAAKTYAEYGSRPGPFCRMSSAS